MAGLADRFFGGCHLNIPLNSKTKHGALSKVIIHTLNEKMSF